MDSIPHHIRSQIVGILRYYTFQFDLCKCNSTITAAIQIDRVVSMSTSCVTLEGSIIQTGSHMDSNFLGFSLVSKQCQHEKITKVNLVVSSEQWSHCIRNHQKVAVIGAKVSGNTVDVTSYSAGIIPLFEESNRLRSDVISGELFSGGFSGWSQVFAKLMKNDKSIFHRWALDKEVLCRQMYTNSYHVPVTAFDASVCHEAIEQQIQKGVNPHIFFHSPIEQLWWCCFATSMATDLITWSPPCPPWSEANVGQGFARSDGLILVHAIAILAILKPKVWVMVMENVKTMQHHRHFDLIRALIHWAGFKIRWITSLNLEEKVPHRRERLLILATHVHTDSLCHHLCLPWPETPKPSLGSYHAICELNDFWKGMALLSSDELSLYLDPRYLPHRVSESQGSKRTHVDVGAYRFRSPDQSASCFLTTYGMPLTMDFGLIAKGGLYGSLLCLGDSVRKFTAPEICILLGVIVPTWIPGNIRDCTQLLGNAIAVPHAAIAIANALMFLIPQKLDMTVHDLFAMIVSPKLDGTNIKIEDTGDGFWLTLMEPNESSIPATIPMRHFGMIKVISPVDEYNIECENGINIMRLLSCLTGPSIPGIIKMRLQNFEDQFVALNCHSVMPDHCIETHTNVPSRLVLSELAFLVASDGSNFVFVLSRHGLVGIHRSVDLTCRDVLDILTQKGSENFLDSKLVSLIGNIHDDLDSPPDFVFLLDANSPRWIFKSEFVNFRLHENKGCFECTHHHLELKNFIQFSHKHGLLGHIRALGWNFSTDMIADISHAKVGMLHPSGHGEHPIIRLSMIPGTLAIDKSDIRRFIIARIFRILLEDIYLYPSEDDVLVSIKLWNSWLWTGLCPSQSNFQEFFDAWRRANLVFDVHHEIALVTRGIKVNPDFTLQSYLPDDPESSQSLKLHVVGTLHGGGSGCIEISLSEQSELSSSLDPREHENVPNFEMKLSSLISDMQTLRQDQRLDRADPLSLDCLVDLRLTELNGCLHVSFLMTRCIHILQLCRTAGIEDILKAQGWNLALQFLSFDSPVHCRIVIFPTPTGTQIDLSLVQAFLMSSLFVVSLPRPISRSSDSALVSIKLWRIWVFRELVPLNWQVNRLFGQWNRAASFVHFQSEPRFVSRGQHINVDRPISDFVIYNGDGMPILKLHLICELTGGGGPQPKVEDTISVKNRLAAFLLEQGCDIQAVSQFVDKVLHSAGHVTIQHILKIDHHDKKVEALSQLARTLNITFPDINKAASKRIQQTKKRIADNRVPSMNIQPDQFSLKPGFITNADGSNCQHLTNIRAGACGVAIVSAESAAEWIKTPNKVSPDELAILVLGKCPANDSSCQALHVPAFDSSGHPVILSTCLHNLGAKDVKISQHDAVSVQVHDTQVIALTLYKAELEGFSWEEVIQSPCKICIQILTATGCDVTMPSSPWGRSWHGFRGKVQPQQAESFQCHIRIAKTAVNPVLRASGFKGLYTTPKTDQHDIDKRYCIVWDDRSLPELVVLANSHTSMLGLIKTVKASGKKISRGIRCLRADFADVHELVKPGSEIPDITVVEWVAKIVPTPVGANFEDVKKFLQEMKWQARPLKALGSQAWLIGAPNKFDASFGRWNDQVLLIHWLPKKNAQNPKIIVASHSNKTSFALDSSNTKDGVSDDATPDAWANWITPVSHQSSQSSIAPKDRSVPIRALDGPVEERFKKQESEIEALKNQMHSFHQKLDHESQVHTKFQDTIRKDISQIQVDTAKAIGTLQHSFDDTLQKALQKQDRSMHDNFSELKNLILNRPLPAKKAKTSKPTGEDPNPEDADVL